MKVSTPSLGMAVIKNVKDLVLNNFGSTENGGVWRIMKTILNKHEYERYLMLANVTNDTGRGRAWLRSVPNEQSLERYLRNDDCIQHVEEFSVSESAPIEAEFHKPNAFSTLLKSSAVSKVKSARPVTMATMTGRVTRNKAAITRSNNGITRQKKTVEIVKESVPAEKNQKEKATKAPSKKIKVSFAPDNFEFKLNFPLQSVAEDSQESVEIQEEKLKASTPARKPSKKEIKEATEKVEETSADLAILLSALTQVSPPLTSEPVQPRGRRRVSKMSSLPALTEAYRNGQEMNKR